MRAILTIIFFQLFISYSVAQYFQQTVNYTINVSLDDEKHELFANETVEYINNSPDELTEIYFHLWPNAYKNSSTALAKQQIGNKNTKLYYAKKEELGFIDELNFSVNNKTVKWEVDAEHIDICKLILNEPLKSGETIQITTPFHVKLPKTFSRLGHIEESYQITQWYPKPAVYDQYGWHPMPYLDQGEFFSEFGTYDVYITIPRNYVVGATGNLIDGENELKWLQDKVNATEKIDSFDVKDLSFPISDEKAKTLHYYQENVHDFAWFADKRFHVLKGEVKLPHSGRTVTLWAMFTNVDAPYWKNSIQYLHDAVYYYSLWNGDYPYDVVTGLESALSAGGGMEYPTITVIGRSDNAEQLEQVLVHEVGHNWFYGILGSNEREHPWMDEGINSFNECRYVTIKNPKGHLKIGGSFIAKVLGLNEFLPRDLYYLGYIFNAKENLDQPIEYPSPDYHMINYGAIVYMKTAAVMNYLQAYIGEENLDIGMKNYYNNWKFKHPYPIDFKNEIIAISDKNLNWFFDDMINSTKKLDYKIIKATKESSGYKITLKNTGQVSSPINISGIHNDSIIFSEWVDGFEGKETINFPDKKYTHFQIDPEHYMPEVNRKNNILKTKGLFKKMEPLKLQLGTGIDLPKRTQLFYLPAIGWNYHNSLMLGLLVHNRSAFRKKFEFAAMPMYSFGSKGVAGGVLGYYHIMPQKGIFQKVSLGVRGAQYAYGQDDVQVYEYKKLVPEAIFTFRKKQLRKPILQTLKLSSYLLTTSALFQMPYLNVLKYSFENYGMVNPFSISAKFEQTNAFVKSSITAKYAISFKGKSKGIFFRLFAGKFLWENSSEYYGNYNFRMSGWTGYNDYYYDHLFLGRNVASNSVLFQQYTEIEGAFKLFSSVGQSNNWITALNIKVSPPFKLPLSLYADIGTYANAKNAFNGSELIMYNIGIQLSLLPNIVDIYFPLTMSKDMQNWVDLNTTTYWQTIRFSLNIKDLNPENLLKRL